mgnify:CR=1 FL=1
MTQPQKWSSGSYGYNVQYFEKFKETGRNLEDVMKDSVLDPNCIPFPEAGEQLIKLIEELTKQIDELTIERNNNQKCSTIIRQFVALPVIDNAVGRIQEINEIISAQLENYEKTIEQIQTKIDDKQKILTDYQNKLDTIKKNYKNDYYDRFHFEDYEKIKKSDLDTLPFQKLMYLVYKRLGVCEDMERLRSVSMGGCGGGVDYFGGMNHYGPRKKYEWLSDSSMRLYLSKSLKKMDVSCNHCGSIFHVSDNCLDSRSKYCFNCKCYGHETCWNPSRDSNNYGESSTGSGAVYRPTWGGPSTGSGAVYRPTCGPPTGSGAVYRPTWGSSVSSGPIYGPNYNGLSGWNKTSPESSRNHGTGSSTQQAVVFGYQ